MIEEVKRLQNCEISSFHIENEDLKELMSNYNIFKQRCLSGEHETHPDLYEGFKQGFFGIKRTTKPFSRQPIDLVLEQTINADAARKLHSSEVPKDQLINISSGRAVSPPVEAFLLNIERNGDYQRETFFSECLSDINRFEKPIKKISIDNFSKG
ncbi:hypothetical protein TNCV_2207821 [Trichonephila clavipes]|uniref:Uncharacterized protein n=1 Tax=Trichonephila clavipes TaxID=2585209 RepID=A0A8X6S2P9_TRICX|nr:hypothetical protein TNCV_2207821 [Trichonephila clavipes]